MDTLVATTATLWEIERASPSTYIKAFKIIGHDRRPHLKLHKPFTMANPYGGFDIEVHHYDIGRAFEVKNASTHRYHDCGAGLNVGTLEWTKHCLGRSSASVNEGDIWMEVEFQRKDIACLPMGRGPGSDVPAQFKRLTGKFRCRRFKVTAMRVLTRAEIDTWERDPSMTDRHAHVQSPEEHAWRAKQVKKVERLAKRRSEAADKINYKLDKKAQAAAAKRVLGKRAYKSFKKSAKLTKKLPTLKQIVKQANRSR